MWRVRWCKGGRPTVGRWAREAAEAAEAAEVLEVVLEVLEVVLEVLGVVLEVGGRRPTYTHTICHFGSRLRARPC